MKRKQSKNGLTLVEIMVAITIIALLVAGLYSVSNYVETQSKIRLTKSTIEVLCTALEQYHDFDGNFPDITVASDYPATCDTFIERLYYKLSLAPDAKKILNQISPSLIKDADNDKYAEIVDAWETNFKYSYTSGDNFPLVISAGPDKDFNKTADNISSR
jgi:prepilin-type N-terminal cleavage/methylation domain-containing protein